MKMHRLAVENNLRREYLESMIGNSEAGTTPLRGSLVGPPRRILDFESVSHRTNLLQERTFNHNSLTRSTACSSSFTGGALDRARLEVDPSSSRINVLNSVTRNNNSYIQAAHHLNEQSYGTGDRFIPRRRGVDIEVSRYLHTLTEKDKELGSHYLDVFHEVKNATDHWRRKHMQSAFQSLNVFEGLKNKRVLNIGREPSLTGGCRRLMVQEFVEDCQWPCHPRTQPHMNMRGDNSKRYRDHGAQIFRFAVAIRFQNVIDWSAKDELAAGMANTLCVCDVNYRSSLSKVYRVDQTSDLCSVKWNSRGTQVSISGIDGQTSVYDTAAAKIVWTIKCPCNNRRCITASTVWASSDRHLITGCNRGTLNIMKARNGHSITVKEYPCEIRTVSVSENGKYLALSGTDRLVRVFAYPSMEPLFEIAFFTTIKAMAWHPWRSSILCIGGGPGDGALSLWNVSSQTQLSYKKIDFVGSVDSLMFNKISGELLVHWFYLANDKLNSKIVILANLNRIVDCVPIQPEHKMLNIIWGPDHTRLAMHHRDTLVIWDFFGNDAKNWSKYAKKEKSKPATSETSSLLRMDDFTDARTSLAHAKRGKPFSWYTIR